MRLERLAKLFYLVQLALCLWYQGVFFFILLTTLIFSVEAPNMTQICIPSIDANCLG